ncbi:MAG: hypothetical protein KAW86_03265, partial [Bacteroidales bacterium]|nr:hypothetical protein [Bacteroidales bacterium]
TIRFENEETEFEKYFNKFPEGCKFDDDINIIIKWIDIIAEKSALERLFRYEGKFKDNVSAIPIETSKLRLYVLRISDGIIILGNGGVKDTKTYNENLLLNSYVYTLQEIDRQLKLRIKKNQTQLYNNYLYGDLTFDIRFNNEKK